MLDIYLVGGAVRGQLLGLPVREKDWVVVGATESDMLQQGFKQVGKDFPVFLHPKTQEEYALARTERKTGRGYTGFAFDASPNVTLEQDLLRRDLTINAMAMHENDIIDPYDGKKDLEKKLLRHVSSAFVEDPVRILRVARFAARFAGLGFTVAPETMDLMHEMVNSGEVNALVAERVWKEWERALKEAHPEAFFQVLNDCGALAVLFPEINMTGNGMTALIHAAKKQLPAEECFAALLHDILPDQINTLCQRYRVPSAYYELAILVAKYGNQCLAIQESTAEQILALLQSVDAFRRPNRFRQFLDICYLEVEGDEFLWQLYQLAAAVDVKKWLTNELKGKQIAERLNQERLQIIKERIFRAL